MGSHSAGGRHRAAASSTRKRPVGAFTALALLVGGIGIGGFLDFTGGDDSVAVASVAQERGLNLEEVCSAINADTIAKFRESNVVTVEVPPEFDDNTLIASLSRRQLQCSGETVSGAEANRRICNNLTLAGVRQLATRLGVEEAESAKIVEANVQQGRDVFACETAAAPTTPTTDAEPTEEPGSFEGIPQTNTTTAPVPGDPNYQPEGQVYRDGTAVKDAPETAVGK